MATPTFSMKINGLDDMVKQAKESGPEYEKLLLGAMVKGTTWIQEDAKRIGPGRFKNRTGNLRRAIFRRVQSAARGIIGVESGTPYGEYVEFGTPPHVIRPKKGKWLAFKSSEGKTIFAREVRHPGSKPYPFMEPALKDNVDKIKNEYDRCNQIIVKKLAS